MAAPLLAALAAVLAAVLAAGLAVPASAAPGAAATGRPAAGQGEAADRAAPSTRGALAWALNQLGARVRSGGGPGYDSASFTLAAYRAAGFDLRSRTPLAQYADRRAVRLVPLAKAQPGDLVFLAAPGGTVPAVGIVYEPQGRSFVAALDPKVGVSLYTWGGTRSFAPAGAPDPRGVPQSGSPPVVGRVVAGPVVR